jgi:hypothetical protein
MVQPMMTAQVPAMTQMPLEPWQQIPANGTVFTRPIAQYQPRTILPETTYPMAPQSVVPVEETKTVVKPPASLPTQPERRGFNMSASKIAEFKERGGTLEELLKISNARPEERQRVENLFYNV